MLDLTKGILGSYLFGLVLCALTFGYFSLAEFLQRWSDSGPQYKQWIRRGGHFTLMLGSTILIVYSALFFVSLTLPSQIKNFGRSGAAWSFIVCLAIVFLPCLQFRKHLLRKWKVKKLWQ